MKIKLNDDLLEQDYLDNTLTVQDVDRTRKRKVQEKRQKGTPYKDEELSFSYHASQHEKQWLIRSIQDLYAQNWIEDILLMVRGGKEATVYLCTAPEVSDTRLLAAKVYRPRRFRNLKNDHLYREGRDQLDATGKIILDDRAHHAMQKRTAYGLELLHSSWVGHEFRTMQILADAGVDMPRPFVSSDNVILMSYIGDQDTPAPTLNTIELAAFEARELFQRVIHNVELMLSHDRIHADLSAYNILYWNGGIFLIDFPQAINPDENHNAYRILARDIARICGYFSSQGVICDPEALTRSLWKSKGRNLEPSIDPHFLDPENDDDVRHWKSKGA